MANVDSPRALLVAFLSAIAVSTTPVTAASAAGWQAPASGPQLAVSDAQMRAVLHCVGDLAASPKAPVLLIHSDASKGGSTFDWNYMRALPADGHSACTIDLPGRSLIDLQPTSEYVVAAIRYLASAGRRKVDVLGYGVGGIEPLWALKWWPDIREKVDDYVGLGTAGQGLASLEAACNNGHSCPATYWQIRANSNFMTAMQRGGLTPLPADYTSVISQTDELAAPEFGANPIGVIPGAANIFIQSVCPGRVADHLQMLFDAAAYAIAQDALDHQGPAVLSRTDTAACSSSTMPGVDVATLPSDLAAAGEVIASSAAGAALVDGEPGLACYAAGAPCAAAADCVPRLTFTLRHPRGQRVVRAVIFISGRAVRTLRGHDLLHLTVSRPAKTTYTLRIVTTTNAGTRSTSTRTYRACTKTAPVNHTTSHHHA